MEMLKSKTPEMAQKELLSHLLAYNLLRTLMQQSSNLHSKISLQKTRQLFNATVPLLALSGKTVRKRLYEMLIQQVANALLTLRPNRHEPRVVKRRPKSFPRMRQTRLLLKARLAM
jgi:hypothetical protein